MCSRELDHERLHSTQIDPHRFIYNPATYVVYSVSICFAFSLIGVLFFIIFTKVFLLPIMDFHTKGLHPLSRLNIFR